MSSQQPKTTTKDKLSIKSVVEPAKNSYCVDKSPGTQSNCTSCKILQIKYSELLERHNALSESVNEMMKKMNTLVQDNHMLRDKLNDACRELKKSHQIRRHGNQPPVSSNSSEIRQMCKYGVHCRYKRCCWFTHFDTSQRDIRIGRDSRYKETRHIKTKHTSSIPGSSVSCKYGDKCRYKQTCWFTHKTDTRRSRRSSLGESSVERLSSGGSSTCTERSLSHREGSRENLWTNRHISTAKYMFININSFVIFWANWVTHSN